MCGRFAQISPSSELENIFEVTGTFELPPRYNIAPSQDVAVVRLIDQQRQLSSLRWGLIPAWAKDATIGYKMFNARSETAHEKPSFRAAFKSRRCLVPASGFYEWDKVGKTKQPYYISRRDQQPLAFAGLWEEWTDRSSGEIISTCTILTTTATQEISRIHDRMPVILEPDVFDLWLDPTRQRHEELASLFEPQREDILQMTAVSTYVNKAGNEGSECVESVQGGKR